MLAVLSALLHLLQLIFLCPALKCLSLHCKPSLFPFFKTCFSPHKHTAPHILSIYLSPSLLEGCAPSSLLPALIWSLIGWGSYQIWSMISCLLPPREMALVLWEQDLITGTYERAMEEREIKGHRKKQGGKLCQLSMERVDENRSGKGSGKTRMMKRCCIKGEQRGEDMS